LAGELQEETEAARKEALAAKQQLAEAQEKIRRLEEKLSAANGKYLRVAFFYSASRTPSSCLVTRETELVKAREGFVDISKVHKQVELMNTRHAAGLEELQKAHLAELSKMQKRAETAESHATEHSKNFNALAESHSQELKSKEHEIEEGRTELHKLEDAVKLLCADMLGESILLENSSLLC
jgi:DNA repair exonuclease SbcCD ATPase subunit